MKHLKFFEKHKIKDIKIGNIYNTGEIILRNEIITIPLVKIISIKGGRVNIKTYTKVEHTEEFIQITKSWLNNIASPSEIDQFEIIEQINKYNL